MQNLSEIDKITIEGRKKLNMTCVSSVDGFSENVLKLTVLDSKITINGENIKITAFNKDSGNLIAEGVFNEIKYNFKKPSFIKRVLK